MFLGGRSHGWFIDKVLLRYSSGTKRTVHTGYEEVFIPPTPTAPLSAGEELVPIASLDEWAQLAFDGMTHLNRIQSRIFEAAYRSNENLLVRTKSEINKPFNERTNE